MKSLTNLRKGLALVLCAAMLMGDTTMLQAAQVEATTVGAVVSESKAETEVAEDVPTEEVEQEQEEAEVVEPQAEATEVSEAEEKSEETQVEAPDVETALENKALEATYTATVGETTVTVVAPEGAFAEEVTLQVTEVEITDEMQAQLDEQAIAEQKAINSASAYDISFVNAEGKEVEPAKEVQVSIATAEVNSGDDASVYHFDEETATVEDMGAATTADGDVAFETDHFSTYVIVNKTADITAKIHHVYWNPKTKSYEELFKTDTKQMRVGGQINNYNKADDNYWDVKVYQKKNGNNFSDELSTDKEIEAVQNVKTNDFTGFEMWVVYTAKEPSVLDAPVTFWDYQVKPNGKYVTNMYTVDVHHVVYDGNKDTRIEKNKYYFSNKDYQVNDTIETKNNVWKKYSKGLFGSENREGKIVLKVKKVGELSKDTKNELIDAIQKYSGRVSSDYLPDNYYNNEAELVKTDGYKYSINYIDNYRYDNDAFYNANNYYLTIGKSKQDGGNQNYTENSYLGGPKSDDDNIKKQDINYYVSDGIKKDIVAGLKKENDKYTDVLFNYNQPGIYTLNETNGKQVYQDRYTLKFDRTGDTYTLSKVYDSYKKKDYNAGAGFFPLDGIDGAIEGDASNDTESAEGSTVKHNDFFGMRYDVNFQIGDYNGPLQYKFKGDDDLWVLLDGNVVIDLGGIHQAVESGTTETNHYVDLWQFLGGRENYDPTAQHTLTVLYLERGGYDSNCNMEFTIPHAGIISYSVPTGDLDFTKVNEDGEPLAGATFELKGKNGTSVTATSDENGIVHFGGLYVGNYTMTETDAPDDYEASTETWNVSVVATGETTAVATLKNASDESITEIVNKKLLPPPEITFDNEKTVAVNSYKDRTYTITLQANSTTQTSTNVTTGGPVDVMLLLDVSGSMNEKMDSYNRAGTYRSLKRTYYTSVLFVSLEHKNAIYDYENYFVEVGGSYYQIQEKIDSNFWGTENNYSYYYNGPSGKRTAVDDTTVLYSKMRLSALHASASQFLASLASKAPESKVGIVTFSSKDDNGYGGYSTLRGLETIGADASNAILSLDGMVPYGGTSPELAMQEAQRQFATVSNDGRKKIAILFTDGNPTGNRDFKYLSNEDINKIEYWDSKDDSENAAYELKQSGVSIYTVGFALGENAKDWLSGTIATSSSYALTAETQDELIKAFETVSSTITNNTSISNATVVDVLDPRFELVDDEEERLRSELEDGEALTVSEDGATITWTGVTLPYDGHWTRTIKIRAKADFIGGNAIPTNVNPGSKITAAGKEKEFPQPTVNVKLLDLEGTPSYVEVFLGDTIESKTFLGKLKGSFKISVNDETKKALTEGDYVDSYSGEVLGTVSFETMKKDGVAITSDQDVKNHPADHVGTPAEKYSLVAVYTPLTVAERVAKGYATPAPDAGTEVTVKRSKNESTHEVNVIAGTLTITKKISKLDYKKAYGDPVFTFKITDAKNASKVYYRTVHFTGDEKGLLFTKVSAKIDNLPKGTYVVEELDTMGFKPEGKPSYDGTALNTKRIANDSKVEFTLGKYDGKTYDKEAVTFTNKLKHSSRDTDTDVKKNTIKINEPTSSTDEVDNIKESMVDEEPQE